MSKRSRVKSPTRSSVTIAYEAGDCLVALAARILLCPDTLLPRWPVMGEAPASGQMRRLVFDSDLTLRAGVIWTGRSRDELQVGQLHRWVGTSLLPESVTQTLEGMSARIKTKSIPICPECVRERPYALKAVWRIPIVPICTIHEVVLIDKCTRCGKSLRVLDLRSASVRPESFSAPGCDNCGGQLEKGRAADPDALRATEVVTNSLRHQEVRGREASRVSLDLAAVQDLVNLQLPHLGVRGAQKSVLIHSPDAVARVLPAAVAAMSPDHGWCDPVIHVKPLRLLNYLKGRSGVDRPAVRGLAARLYYLHGKTNMTTLIMSARVTWPTCFPIELSPLVADHLFDAATDLGWDPSTKDLLRWTALLTAAAFETSGGKPIHETAMTRREWKQLQQLQNAVDARGVGERLEEDARTMAFAFFSTKRIKPAKRRRTHQRLGAAG